MTAITLSEPSVPTLGPRRHSRRIQIGDVAVGGGAPISVQSMTTTVTADVDATLRQIAELTAAGCDIVRVAVPSQDDCDVLLAEGIGDTIRVSLSAPPVDEIKVGHHILASLGLRARTLDIVSCPTCGRCQVDVYTLTQQVEAAFDGFPHPLRVAVMGCIVNGPGEAREADIGVSAGNHKGQIFVKGHVVRTVPESKIIDALVEGALALTEQQAE
jgi:4-hydroxy-3-methylbut-2-en-1-yl diphosphate synthase IspG/GcpE